jgi:NAD(P)-dependent dehydrogenase (short-subunit alcohol dehydrogenase family)
LPTGESINAPLFDAASLSRVAAAQGRLLALLRGLGDAAEPGRGTGTSITSGLQPGMSFRAASEAALGPLEELLDRLREVADVVAFLASPRSSYLTGTIVNVSGGKSFV